MHCPFCAHQDTQVKDSRPSEDGASIRRRRHCTACDSRFTTFERVQIRELFVEKKNHEKRPFDRDKLMRSIHIATRKRNIDAESLDIAVNNIIRKLESMGEHSIPTVLIGHEVMKALAKLDQVAYVRYASVYKDFHEVSDFKDFMKEMNPTSAKS